MVTKFVSCVYMGNGSQKVKAGNQNDDRIE